MYLITCWKLLFKKSKSIIYKMKIIINIKMKRELNKKKLYWIVLFYCFSKIIVLIVIIFHFQLSNIYIYNNNKKKKKTSYKNHNYFIKKI